MARLTAPNGSTVTVSDALAERLLGEGYRAADEPKKAERKPAKKAAAKPSDEK
jgi:hypothetical protein